MKTISFFVGVYEDPSFQSCLRRLDEEMGNDPATSSKRLYQRMHKEPSNEQVTSIHRDHLTCLNLLYELVNEWDGSPNPQVFEHDIASTFGLDRLQRSVRVCVVMERAHILFYRKRPWFSELHLHQESHLAKTNPGFYEWITASLQDDAEYPTMDRRLYKLINTPQFQLMQDTQIATWELPALVSVEEGHVICESLSTRDDTTRNSMDQKPAAITLTLARPLSGEQNKNDVIVSHFVDAYKDDSLQIPLERLYHDLGSQDAEEWARELYITLRNDQWNARAFILHQDHQLCLSLLFEIVGAWERNGRSQEFAASIKRVFRMTRILRILKVCLVMERAQSLHGIISTDPQGQVKIGLDWVCELHYLDGTFYSEQDRRELMGRLERGTVKQTMDKRLYLLLFHEAFNIQQHDMDIARWSRPHAVSPVASIHVLNTAQPFQARHQTDQSFDSILMNDQFDRLPSEEEFLRDLFSDQAGTLPLPPPPPPPPLPHGQPIQAQFLASTFPSDCHFLCRCSNFDPLDNELLRNVLRDHFRYVLESGRLPRDVLPELGSAQQRLDQVAKTRNQQSKPYSRFRIWAVCQSQPRATESNWESLLVEEITDNVASLKKKLGWPLRKAREDAVTEFVSNLLAFLSPASNSTGRSV